MTVPSFPIRVASQMSGVTIDTVRAWERRYRAVVPARGARGRLYSQAQVSRLRVLRQAVDAGFSIGQIAPLSDAELSRILPQDKYPPVAPGPKKTATAETAAVLAPILRALENFDAARAEQELSRLATLLAPRELIRQVLFPLLRDIGDKWHEGRLRIAQEHIISSMMRGLLGMLLRMYQRSGPAVGMAVATPSGERHEFGVLAAAMLAASKGMKITYIGPDLPAAEILHTAKKTKAQVVLLGLTRMDRKSEPIAEARWLAGRLPASIELWIGGHKPPKFVKGREGGRLIFLEDFDVLEQHLERVRAWKG